MRYKDVENLKTAQFKHLTGVKREAFEHTPTALNETAPASKKYPGRGAPPKLSNADKLLLLLMYYRECRTQSHIATTKISESRVCEIVRDVETFLIRDSRFHLPGKRALLKDENSFEAALIDVTESLVERQS